MFVGGGGGAYLWYFTVYLIDRIVDGSLTLVVDNVCLYRVCVLQVFKKLGLNPYDLNVDQLDMHAVSAHDWHVVRHVGVAYSLVHCLVTFF